MGVREDAPGLWVLRLEFQEGLGGRILEHVSDGSVLHWAEVIGWEPPRRVLAWKPHPAPEPPLIVAAVEIAAFAIAMPPPAHLAVAALLHFLAVVWRW